MNTAIPREPGVILVIDNTMAYWLQGPVFAPR